MILVRNQIWNMLGGEKGKITLGRIKDKFRISSNKNASMVQYIGILGGCGLGGCFCKVYDCVRHAEGCGMLLAKGCDRITALTPCKQKHPLSFTLPYPCCVRYNKMVPDSTVKTQLIRWWGICYQYNMFRPLHWAIIRPQIVPQRRLYSVVFATRSGDDGPMQEPKHVVLVTNTPLPWFLFDRASSIR